MTRASGVDNGRACLSRTSSYRSIFEAEGDTIAAVVCQFAKLKSRRA